MKKSFLLWMLTFTLLIGLVNASYDDAVLYYSFDSSDVSGVNVDDLSSSGFDGTINGASNSSIGILGESLHYDGTNDFVYKSDENDLDLTGSYSYSLWFYANSSITWGTNRRLLMKDDGADTNGGYGSAVWSQTSLLITHNPGGNTLETITARNTSQWYHLVVTYNATNKEKKIYLDNNLLRTDTESNDVASETDDFCLGTYCSGSTPQGQYWHGMIDEVAVYDYNIGSDGVSALWSNGTGFNPYATVPGPSVKNFSIVVTDEWSGADVDNVSVNFPPCYQESANISNQTEVDGSCDLNYSGSYDLSSYSRVGVVYAKPEGFTSANWIVKHGNNFGQNVPYNITIPDSCWDANSTHLNLRFNVARPPSSSSSWGECYNGTGWEFLGNNYSSGASCGTTSSVSSSVFYDGNWSTYGHGNSFAANTFFTGDCSGNLYEEAIYWISEYYSNSTGNVLYTTIQNDSNSTYDFIITGEDYFSKSYASVNVSTDLSATLHQSEVNFSVFELNSNNSLSADNCTVNTTTQNCGVLFNLTAGTYNVTIVKSGYYDLVYEFNVSALDNKTVNTTGMYNTIINVSALDIVDNSTINAFSGWLYDINNSVNTSFSTTSGYVDVPGLNNTNYNLSVSPDGYATETKSFTTNDSLYFVNTSHYLFNSVNLIVKDVGNDSIINWTTITINTIYDNTSFANTTSNGTFGLSLLAPNNYELRLTASGYVTTSRFVTVLNDSTQQLIIYMDSNLTESQTLRVIDIGSNRVSGAIVTIQKEVLNSTDLWISVGQVETDSEGQAIAFLEKDPTIFYRFSVSLDGVPLTIGSGGGLLGQTSTGGGLFTTKTSFISGINEIVQIVVQTEESEDTDLSELQGISYNVTYGVNDTSVLFDFVDARSTIVGGRLLISGRYLNTTGPYEVISNQTVLSSSGSISYFFPVVNNTDYLVQAYILFQTSESLVHERNVLFDIDLLINRGTGLLIGIVLLAFVAVLTYAFGPLISGSLFVGSMFGLARFGLVNISNGLITTLLAIVIILFIRIRGNR